jgi:uncharacterized protein with GYD domain
VAIIEAPDDHSASGAALSIRRAGNVSGETLHTYSVEDIGNVVAELA